MSPLPTIQTRRHLRLVANGVELLDVATGGTTALTVSSVAMFRCITTGLPVPFQPRPLPLFWYPPLATKPRPPIDKLPGPLLGDTDLDLGLGPGDGPLTAFACKVGLPDCHVDSNITDLPPP